jgi:hypothetical protein
MALLADSPALMTPLEVTRTVMRDCEEGAESSPPTLCLHDITHFADNTVICIMPVTRSGAHDESGPAIIAVTVLQ